MTKLMGWRFLLADIEKIWRRYVHYDEENDCETFQCSDNVKEMNQCLERQFDILRSLDQKLMEELESQAKVMYFFIYDL